MDRRMENKTEQKKTNSIQEGSGHGEKLGTFGHGEQLGTEDKGLENSLNRRQENQGKENKKELGTEDKKDQDLENS
jgi:hypothetical protein